MRWVLTVGLLMALAAPLGAASIAGVSASPEPRAASWRPRAWHPPARPASAVPGLRVEPEDGGATPSSADLEALGAARRQALANVPVVTRADGSRYAVIGGLVRAYTVVHVGADGRLVQECVHSEEQARQRVAAGSREK